MGEDPGDWCRLQKDISDVRESPALKVIDSLKKEFVKVSYHDPYVPVINAVEPMIGHGECGVDC